RTPSQSLSRALTGIRLSSLPLRSGRRVARQPPAGTAGAARAGRAQTARAAPARLAPTVLACAWLVTRLDRTKGGRLGRAQRQKMGDSHARSAPCGPYRPHRDRADLGRPFATGGAAV